MPTGQGLTVPYSEVGIRDGSSPVDTFRNSDSRSTRKLLFAWSDVPRAIFEVLGYSFRSSGGGTPRLSRYLPLQHPVYPFLYATAITSSKGIGFREKNTSTATGDPIPEYEKVELTVEFQSLTYKVRTDEEAAALGGEQFRFVTVETQVLQNYLSLPEGSMVWSEGPPRAPKGIPIAASVGFVEVRQVYRVTWHLIPEEGAPFTTISQVMGTMNRTAFRIDTVNKTFAPGTLLLAGVEFRPIYLPYVGADYANGLRAWDITYVFHERSSRSTGGNPARHDRVYFYGPGGANAGYYQICKGRREDGDAGPYDIATVPDNRLVYDPSEFADLFKLV